MTRISKTLFAMGTHWDFPARWRQRFMRRAVEYSRPYILTSLLARNSVTSQVTRPRSSSVLRIPSLPGYQAIKVWTTNNCTSFISNWNWPLPLHCKGLRTLIAFQEKWRTNLSYPLSALHWIWFYALSKRTIPSWSDPLTSGSVFVGLLWSSLRWSPPSVPPRIWDSQREFPPGLCKRRDILCRLWSWPWHWPASPSSTGGDRGCWRLKGGSTRILCWRPKTQKCYETSFQMHYSKYYAW